MGLNGKNVVLHNIKARYTVLYFWDSNCGHCKTVTPKLLEVYHKYRSQGIETYAVNIEGDLEGWKKYIEENKLDWINAIDPYRQSSFKKDYDIYATPVIYLLDEKKEIIAKRLAVEQLDEIIEKLLKESKEN
jgi:thiol-disulfide isomerase/thioredoxin